MLVCCEPVLLLVTAFFFWYPSPNPTGVDRAEWFWLLGLLLVVYAGRFVFYQRLWTYTRLEGWLLAFIALCWLNVELAPYESRGLMMLARPLFGMALLIYLVELARTTRHLERVLWIMVALGTLVGAAAVGATRWDDKSADLYFIIRLLPKLYTQQGFLAGGFNPNEVAGAIAWLLPLLSGLLVYPWTRHQVILRWVNGVGCALLLLGLMVGQSRAAILGVIPALFVMVMLVFPPGRARLVSLSGLALLVVMQYAILMNIFPDIGPQAMVDERGTVIGLSPRDERTTNQRVDIWRSALEMVKDYPLTGVGMARFRYGRVRDDYPVRGFDFPYHATQVGFQRRVIPHAHNEFVQITTDLGVPGLVVFMAWHVTAAVMLWAVWRSGDRPSQIIAAAAGAGLAAHAIYGLADAIPLWDRFSFVFWMMLGVVAAQHALKVTLSKP